MGHRGARPREGHKKRDAGGMTDLCKNVSGAYIMFFYRAGQVKKHPVVVDDQIASLEKPVNQSLTQGPQNRPETGVIIHKQKECVSYTETKLRVSLVSASIITYCCSTFS